MIAILPIALAGVAGSQARELRRSGFLGVQVAVPGDAARQRARLPAATAVEVQKLVDGGSARAAGVESGDLITGIDEHDVKGPDDFVAYTKGLHGGDVATLAIVRGDQRRTIRIEVLPRPYETSPDAEVLYRSIEVDGSLRRVVLTVPKQPGPHAAVLFMTGR